MQYSVRLFLVTLVYESVCTSFDVFILKIRKKRDFYVVSASLSINIASVSANGVNLSPIPSVGESVGLSVSLESVLGQNG